MRKWFVRSWLLAWLIAGLLMMGALGCGVRRAGYTDCSDSDGDCQRLYDYYDSQIRDLLIAMTVFVGYGIISPSVHWLWERFRRGNRETLLVNTDDPDEVGDII